ncbi:MAG TPA: hypothetical protein VLJ61_09210 [Pyrinomonadaceae bacterium]|nr:hypothetical protein [Pyrinomonadaceae bacterium]
MLFGSTMLEVAIGMVFVYLLMSLLCSALNELINSLFKLRAKDLEKGIKRLLDGKAERKGLGKKLSDFFSGFGSPRAVAVAGEEVRERAGKLSALFFDHPLIRPFYEDRKPSYIPARTFSLALWNMATEAAKKARSALITSPPDASGDVVAGVTRNLKELRDTIATLPDEDLPKSLKQSLVTLIDEADNDFDRARENVEKWYDDAMDRVSGKFRRRTQYILIALGFTIALVMNVDSFNIFKALWNSGDLRKSVADVAETYAKSQLPTPTPTPNTASGSTTPSGGANNNSNKGTNTNTGTGASTNANSNKNTNANANSNKNTNANTNTNTSANTNTNTNINTNANTNAGAGTTPTSEGESSDEKAKFDAAVKRINNLQMELNGLGLPIGWDCSRVPVASGDNSKTGTDANANTGTNTNDNTNANKSASVSPTPAPRPARQWKCSNIADNPRGTPQGLLPWLLKLAGIFLTAMAVSQGAPFWFDMLNKLIVIRSTVKPNEKSQTEGTKDKSAKDGEEDGGGK